MWKRPDVRDRDSCHLVRERSQNPARFYTKTKLCRVPIKGRSFRHVEELDFSELLFGQRDPVETVGVLVDKRPKRTRLDGDQAHRSCHPWQSDRGARDEA